MILTVLTRFIDNSTLLIDLEKNYMILSTAGCPKVFSEVRYIIFKTVPKDFNVTSLSKYCIELTDELGVDHEVATIFLTAVNITSYSHTEVNFRGVRAKAFATLGVDTPSCLEEVSNRGVGTVNIVVVVDKPLNQVGLLDLFRVVSEVKGAVMTLGGPMCLAGASVGTASDATAVVAPLGDESFAGIATDVGVASAKATIEVLVKQLRKYSTKEYLARTLGFNSIDELIEVALDVYRAAKIPYIEEGIVKKELQAMLEGLLTDPNIIMFMRGIRLLEAALSMNSIPVVEYEEYKLDSPSIIVDELAGKAIAEYVGGFKGLLTYYWIERLKKSGEVSLITSLPPMTDDLVGALLGGILSKIYDKYSRRSTKVE